MIHIDLDPLHFRQKSHNRCSRFSIKASYPKYEIALYKSPSNWWFCYWLYQESHGGTIKLYFNLSVFQDTTVYSLVFW
jgi:hypothetical protein